MAHQRRSPYVAAGAAALLTTGLLFGAGASPVSAASNVTAVSGSAYGYRAFNITLFGGKQSDVGPTPTEALASDASNSPQSASATTGLVAYGPGTLFTSDAIAIQSTGSLGTTGSVSTTSSVNNANKATTQSSTGSENLTADNIAGSCSAGTSGNTGSTSITNGTLQTDNGLDLNNDGNYTDPGEHPPVVVSVPSSPAPNTSISGHVHLSSTSTDTFHYVFNEQTTSGSTLTVNPVDEYFDGPTLKGNLIIGQVVCGVTVTVTNTPPVANNDAYSTPFNTQLVVPAPGVLANDTDADGNPLTASKLTNPSNGTVTMSSDGSFTYTPSSTFSGNDSFTYTVSDGQGGSAVGTVTITVGAPPGTDLSLQNPGITHTPDPVGLGGTVTFTITITNLGPNDAPGAVDVTSLTDARLTGATSSVGACAVSKGKTKVVTCNLGTIASGASATVQVMAKAPHKAGTITMTSSVSSPAPDPNSANNSATDSVSIQ